MVYCTRCGTRNDDKATQCIRCGASLASQVMGTGTVYRRERDECFGGEQDAMGLVSFGVFLIVLAVTWIRYPTVGNQFVDYFQSFAQHGRPVMLPPQLCEPIIFFLSLLGFWNLMLAGIRTFTRGGPRRAVSDAVTGLGLLYVAFILLEYTRGAITASLVLPVIVIGLGALIILAVFLRFLIPKKP